MKQNMPLTCDLIFRAKKLDWEKIKFDDMSADDCQKYWFYIQERIRRYRILSELIPGKQIETVFIFENIFQ